MKLVKYSKWIYCAVCVLFIAMGVCLTVYPEISVTGMSSIFGAVALAFGIIKIVGYFSDDLYGLVFQFDLALGLFSSVLGVLFLLRPKWLMTALPLAFGVFVLINSLFSIQSAVDAKNFGLRKWWLMLLLSLVAAVAGLVLIFEPEKSGIIWVVITGISFIISGAEKLVVALFAIRTPKKGSSNSPITVEYTEISEEE